MASPQAFALQQGETRFNGFGTAGITHLGGEQSGRNYGVTGQTNDSWRGEQLSKVAEQFQYGVTDSLSFTAQGIVKADQDSYKLGFEWMYLSWQANDNFLVRAGRLRAPVYMYSETLDVGFTYPWLHLPDEVYGQVQLSNYEGVDAIYTLPVPIGSVMFQVGGGQAKNRNFYAFDDQYRIDYRNTFAANVSLATNNFGSVRIGYVQADLDLDIDAIVNTPIGITSQKFLSFRGNTGKFTSVGYQYDNGTWLSADEFTRRVTDGDSSPSTDAFYFMGGRRFGDFLAHLTYAQLDEGSRRQRAVTYGLNYNITPSVILKGEYKRVDTTGGYAGNFVKTNQEAFDGAVHAVTGLGAPTPNFDGDIISVGLDFVF
jgi:hypothetical protein